MTYLATILADNPTHLWKLDETSGSVANDTGSGTAIPLAITGAILLDQAGFVDSSPTFGFPNSSAAVLVGASALADSGGGTFDCLFQTTGGTTTYQTLFHNGQNGSGYLAFLDPDLHLCLGFYGPAPSYNVITGPVESGIPHHFALTFDPTHDNTLSIWLDGALYYTQVGSSYTAASNNCYIGNVSGGFAYPFSGTLQFAAWYESVLTATQIQTHATALPTASPVVQASQAVLQIVGSGSPTAYLYQSALQTLATYEGADPRLSQAVLQTLALYEGSDPKLSQLALQGLVRFGHPLPPVLTVTANGVISLLVGIPSYTEYTQQYDLYSAPDDQGIPGTFTLLETNIAPNSVYTDTAVVLDTPKWYALLASNTVYQTWGPPAKGVLSLLQPIALDPKYTPLFPVGYEVGQRMLGSGAAWPTPPTAAVYPLDVVHFTQIRQKALLSRHALGFTGLPTWMAGSARAVELTPTEYLPFPDTSISRRLRDLVFNTPLATLLIAARYSPDAAFRLDTGPGIPSPRTAYAIPPVSCNALYSGGPPSSSGSAVIRPATSLWDFMTAFDAVWLPSEDGSVILRNLDSPVLCDAQLSPGATGTQGLSVAETAEVLGGVIDSPAAAVWNDARSLRDDTYTPPLMTTSPTSAGLDLAGDSLRDLPGSYAPFWTDTPSVLVYPTPIAPHIVLNNPGGTLTWDTTNYPANIEGTPESGQSYLLIPTQALGPHALYADTPTGVVATYAQPITLQNGWDLAGALIRTARRDGESDFGYAGRQQRLWATTVRAQQEGYSSGSPERLRRTLSAGTNRTIILDSWDQVTPSSVPLNVTGFDAGDDPESDDQTILYLSQQDLVSIQAPEFSWLTGTSLTILVNTVPATGTSSAFKCRACLDDYATIHVIDEDRTLLPGVDWVLSQQDPSVIIFAQPITLTDDVRIILSHRTRLRTQLSGDALPITRRRDMLLQESLPADNRRYAEQNTLFRSCPQFSTTTLAPFPPTHMSQESGRQMASGTVPLFVARGPRPDSVPQCERRLFTQPGGTLRTPLGTTVLETPTQATWAQLNTVPAESSVGLPFDMDLSAVDTYPKTDGITITTGPYLP